MGRASGHSHFTNSYMAGIRINFLREIRPDIVDTIISIPIILLLHYEYKKYIRNYDINSN